MLYLKSFWKQDVIHHCVIVSMTMTKDILEMRSVGPKVVDGQLPLHWCSRALIMVPQYSFLWTFSPEKKQYGGRQQ